MDGLKNVDKGYRDRIALFKIFNISITKFANQNAANQSALAAFRRQSIRTSTLPCFFAVLTNRRSKVIIASHPSAFAR